MLNIIWAGMIILGVIYGAFSGNMQDVGSAVVDSSKEAINLCITMLGVMAFWCGTMHIATTSGLTARLTHMIEPFVNWMFPKLKENTRAKEHISMNIIANVLGMGWAATPAGLNAMKELSADSKEKGRNKPHVASDEMCTFLVLNISSLQLIPVNIIAYRSQYGSVNPTAVVGPAILATFVSTIAAIIFCKIMQSKNG